MLRSLARTQYRAVPIYRPAQAQWLLNRPRTFADARSPDKTVLPGTQSRIADDVPEPPKLAADPTVESDTISTQNIPRTPPAPEDVKSGTGVPLGTGTATVAPSAPPPPPPRRRKGRFRRFLTSLLILSTLGYAGGVYYSLVNDNFHDFFTEYIPYAEDAVAYFEEREFRRRFPPKDGSSRAYPQIRGENKVTIAKQSGMAPRVAAEERSTDLGQKGRHVSAVEDNSPQPNVAQQTPSQASPKERTAAVDVAKKDSRTGGEDKPSGAPAVPPTGAKSEDKPHQPDSKPTSTTHAASQSAAATPTGPVANPLTTHIDNISIPNAAEPVVQDVVKMLNDIITVINNDPNNSAYQTTVDGAKAQLSKIISDIGNLKAQTKKEADDSIANAHKQFDTAARELVNRLEQEMKEQEMHWREEYENERERLAKSYQLKLSTELYTVRKVAEQRAKNALLEQEIALQRRFAQTVKDKVEAERNGRLSRLDELSSSVAELEKLTSEWNSVVDANLATQHLHVAIDAVQAAIAKQDHPTPFINELAALKEISAGNDVHSPTAYQRGIPSSAHLIDRFRRVASEVRKASLLPEDAGVASHAASAVLSRLMFSKKGTGMPDGDDVESVLTRTEVFLEEGDLDGAAREMNSLKGWAGVLSKDWVSECRRVLETRQALDVIATEARLQSLLVD
ncbi:MICOS complex subunit mic60 [Taxawa tesnikishii (nom. ined.)]|nr:MICOS complex subunit mic60 [Dothideales sp. JES 119]